MPHEQQLRRVVASRSANPGAVRRLRAIGAIGAIGVLAVQCAPGPAAEGPSRPTPSVNRDVLAAFVDSFITQSMAGDRIPGASFVFVQNGRVLLSRGYGLANVAQQRRVVPES